MTSTPSSAFAPVASFLAEASLAPRQSHKLLTIWPLRRSAVSASPPYVTLADALARGVLEVEELKTGPTVPHVLVSNRGDVAVLVLFGEEIRGAFQNRIANASFLIPPHGQVTIDVSCVEQGRWSSRVGMRFGATGEVLSSALRHKMATKVAQARAAGGRFDADQGEVWEGVSHRLSHSATRSRTGAYADYVGTRRRDLDEASAAFATVPGQVGFVAARADQIIGLEAIGRPEVFASAFQGLLRAYLIDAIDDALVREHCAADAGPTPDASRFDGPEAFLEALAGAPSTSGSSLGVGADVRIAGGGVCGCALVEGDVIHLTAFPAAAAGHGRGGERDRASRSEASGRAGSDAQDASAPRFWDRPRRGPGPRAA